MTAALQLKTHIGSIEKLSQKPRLGENFAWRACAWKKPAANDCCVREKSKVTVGWASAELVQQTDSNMHVTEYEYDALDRRIRTIFDDVTEQTESYDALGRLTAKTDQAGKQTQYEYDALGRLTAVIDVLNQRTEYTYDEAGNKLTQKDAKGNITRWTYDALGRVLTRTLPEGQTESFQYDANGNQTSHTDFNGDTTTFEYDSNNRLTRKVYPDNSTETFTYDAMGNRLSATDSNGTTTYLYDSRDRLIKETQPNGNVLDYEYDSAGNRTAVITTVGTNITRTDYTFDRLNRLASVTDENNQVTTYTYDNVGNRASVSYPNGNVTTYTYDSLNRLTYQETKDANNNVIASYDYVLLSTGHRQQVTDNTGAVTTYSYDDLYRLIGETINDPVLGVVANDYTYDSVGNRTYATEDGVSTAYTYDSNDRLLTAGGETYSYDNNGNTLAVAIDNTLTSNQYDYNNRLVGMIKTVSGVEIDNVAYAYDIDGLRVAKNDDGIQTNYLVDKNRDYGQVLKELDATNSEVVSYLFGDDLIKQSRASNDSYYLYNGLGSTTALSDDFGVVTDTFTYNGYGVLLDSTGTTANSYLYAGEQRDSESGLYYLRARYMDSLTGRFRTMDTFLGWEKVPVTLHKYAYGNLDPINGVDPSGRFTLIEFGQAATIGALLAATAQSIYLIGQSDATVTSSGSSPTGFSSPSRLPVYLASIGYSAMLNEEHPSHADENEALGMTGAEGCEELAWAIDVLERGIAWREEDLAKHPEDRNNIIGHGHRTRIKNMEKQLDKLKTIYSDKGC